MLEAAGLVVAAAVALIWIDSLRSRERALAAGRGACERNNLQLLDDTIAVAKIRFARDADGRLRIKRTYQFEFSDTGTDRRVGTIEMLGAEVDDVRFEPYPILRVVQ